MANAPIEATVENVLGSEAWTGNDGPMVTDEVLFSGDGRTWKIHRPAADPAPAPGATLRGWKNDGKGTFGVAKDRPQNGAGGRSGGGGKNFDRSPDHPVQMQRALHTSALSSAIPLIEQMFTFGLSDVPKPTTKDEYLKLVEGVATWVQQSYPQAVLDQAAKADSDG
jgi:hypothetical protein